MSSKKSDFVDVSQRRGASALSELDANSDNREGLLSQYGTRRSWTFDADAEAWNPLTRREAGTIPRPASPVLFAKEQVDRHLEGEEEAEIMKILRKLDKDGGGTISMVELRNAFNQLKITPDPDLLEVLLRDYDEDNSGELDFQEFIPMYKELTKLMKERDEQDKDFIDAPNVGDKVLVPKEGRSLMRAEVKDVAIVSERTQYTVQLKETGELLKVGRASVFTLKEAGVPHEEIDKHDLLPPLTTVLPPSPRTLYSRGFQPERYDDCRVFCHRHAFRISAWCKGAVTSQGLSVHTEFVPLSAGEAAALMEGNRLEVDSLRRRLQPLVNSYLNRRHGVIVRLDTTSPADQIIWELCALTAMVMEAKEAAAAVAALKLHHAKGTAVEDVLLAAAAGMEVGHVPSNAHIKVAQEHAKHKEEAAREEKRRRGKARMLQKQEEEEARAREAEENRAKLLLEEGKPDGSAEQTGDSAAEEGEEQEGEEEAEEEGEDEIEEWDDEEMLEEDPEEPEEEAQIQDEQPVSPEEDENSIEFQLRQLEYRTERRVDKLEDQLVGMKALVDRVDERAALVPSVENLDAKADLHRKINLTKAQILGVKDAHKVAVKALKDKDEDLEEGERLVEEEAEGLERLQWLVRHHLEAFVVQEISLRVQTIKQMELSSILQHRNATISCTPLPPPRHVVLRAVSVLQRATRCHQAREAYREVVAAWSRCEGEVAEQGPSQPFERNFVITRGPAIWAYYRGYAITIHRASAAEPPGQSQVVEESQIVRRFTSTRQVQVQSSFSFAPQPGDKFRLHAPETDKTKNTVYKELFYMEDLDGYGALTKHDLQRVLERIGVEIEEEDVEALMSRHCSTKGEWQGKRAKLREFLEMLKDKSISEAVENTPLPEVTGPMQQNRRRRASAVLSRRSSAGSSATQEQSQGGRKAGGPKLMRRNQGMAGPALTDLIQTHLPSRTGSAGSGGGGGGSDDGESGGRKLVRRGPITGWSLEGLLHGESPSVAGGGGLLQEAARAAVGGQHARGAGGRDIGLALRQALGSTEGSRRGGEPKSPSNEDRSPLPERGEPLQSQRGDSRRPSGGPSKSPLVSPKAGAKTRLGGSKRASLENVPPLHSSALRSPSHRGSQVLSQPSPASSKRGSTVAADALRSESSHGAAPLLSMASRRPPRADDAASSTRLPGRAESGAAKATVSGQGFGGLLSGLAGLRWRAKAGIERTASHDSAAGRPVGRRASLARAEGKEALAELNLRKQKEEQTLLAKWALFGEMQDLIGSVKRVEPPTAHPRIRNDDEVKDRVAVIDAGPGVPFLLQAWRAQQVGAIGVVVVRQLNDSHPQSDIFPMPADHTLAEGQSVRIPVVMIKQSDKKHLTDGTYMTLRMHNEAKKHQFDTWPYRTLALGEIEEDVRGDWRCMSNLVLKTFHSVQHRLMAIGSQMHDPNHWTEEQLWNSLQRDGWRPVEDKRYNVTELVKDAFNLKCKAPWIKTERVLKVVIVRAFHLPKKERQRRGTNPYVQVKFGGLVRETGRISHSLDPEWNEEFSFKVTDREVRQKELAVSRSKYDALAKDGTLEPQLLSRMFENTQVHIKPEELPPILARFSERKNHGVTWEDIISIYDEYTGKIEPISIHIMHQGPVGAEKEIGRLDIEVGWLRDGVRISEKMQVMDDEGHEVIGHDGRLCMLDVKISLNSVTSDNFSDQPVTDALNMVMGSKKTKKDLDTAVHLGLEQYPVLLSVRSFLPSLANNPQREFRAFVYEGVLNGISQRHTDLFFAEIDGEWERMQELIVVFFWDHLERRLRDLSMVDCIVDIFVDPSVDEDGQVDHVLALNIRPFHESTSACLYSWSDPNDLAILKTGRVFGPGERDRISVAGQEGTTAPNADFRYRKEPLQDPIGSLPPVWARWMKNLIRDLGITQAEVWREGVEDAGEHEKKHALSKACAIL